ncbi:DUF4184 family protein [Nafulsella turpanensis]|uniref:DUF4184 family protein n=1 Tax=Nafulsella turpanensis TaxID=1265690 RepID=UPI0003474B27|nr:DUF4184 family protein [Nafulsella turpanensis]
MPFTFAHPAIVLPLKKMNARWFSLTGLVTGSITPDFEYFLLVQGTANPIGETILGVFIFDLPMSIVLGLLFHLLVRNPLIRHLPSPFDRRLSGFLTFDFLHYLKRHPWIYILSVIVGAVSHLVLDTVTSPAAMMDTFQRLEQLGSRRDLPLMMGALGEHPFYTLEKAFSAVGMLLILYLLLRTNVPLPGYRILRFREKVEFFSLLSIFMAGGTIASFEFLPIVFGPAQLIISTLSAAMLSLILCSLIFRKRGSLAIKKA